ncbi:MAG: hypothetical protein ACXWV0_01480 [Flavisolibacter sp.]
MYTSFDKSSVFSRLLLRSSGFLLLLLLIQLQTAAQKQPGFLIAAYELPSKNQLQVNAPSRPDLFQTAAINSGDLLNNEKTSAQFFICLIDWICNSVLPKSAGIDDSKTIHVASEKLPSGDHSLFYAVDGNQKFIRFPKK